MSRSLGPVSGSGTLALLGTLAAQALDLAEVRRASSLRRATCSASTRRNGHHYIDRERNMTESSLISAGMDIGSCRRKSEGLTR